MTSNKKLLVIGSINADHVIKVPYFSKPGETLIGSDYNVIHGGKGANQAVAAARLGGDVSFMACIGDDNIGLVMKESYQQDSINVENITTVAKVKTGIAMIQVTDDGENSIVLASGANNYLDHALIIQKENIIKSADAVLLQLETPLDAILTAIKMASNANKTVILNPAPAQPLPEDIYQYIDIITPNETETEILTGILVTDLESAKKAANIFHQRKVKYVVITLGEMGVFFSDQTEQILIPAFKVTPIDTTGAGDTFNGAFIVALLEGRKFIDALAFASAAAAIAVTVAGAQTSIPYRNQVELFMQKNS